MADVVKRVRSLQEFSSHVDTGKEVVMRWEIDRHLRPIEFLTVCERADLVRVSLASVGSTSLLIDGPFNLAALSKMSGFPELSLGAFIILVMRNSAKASQRIAISILVQEL